MPALAGAGALAGTMLGREAQAGSAKGRLKQSVTKGVFKGREMTLDQMCEAAAHAGIYGFDLIGPDDWPLLKKHGLVPTMCPGPYAGTIADGIVQQENHDRLVKSTLAVLDLAAEGGCPNVIALAGPRKGMSDADGADNCVAFFEGVKAHAENKGVTICLELLNSKVNHPDYICDHTAWGVGVMKRVNSPRVKLLYDIYHMQIMEGDVVRTVRENIAYIGHFHTGGNPGRHEIDGTQELNYRFVAQAIADTGFAGVMAHEYTPVRDALQSLAQAVEICTV